MYHRKITVLIIVLGLASLAPAQYTINPANGHGYAATAFQGDVYAARAEAAALGGHLVVINDAAENAWIVANFAWVAPIVWIGLSDEVTEGSYLWDSGEPFGYSNWEPNEPNNSGGEEDHVEMLLSTSNVGMWNDNAWYRNYHGIIEIPFQSFPGSGEDLSLATGINGPPVLSNLVPFATAGDLLTVLLESPLGAYDSTTPVIYAQLFDTGIFPYPTQGLPELHLDFATGAYFQVMVLHTGIGSAPPLDLLAPGGMTFNYMIPPGLQGLNLMIQGFSLAPSANMGNPWFTVTDARSIAFI